ncbi:MAG: glycosyl transferase [Gammaproteobacteria bacterium HGW-Gammaproteobacteria-3]|nr:MAG: glycosyl transferase [Gammaproteobacteria bacterium HGW-Gammaproteobacteria-3]
MNISVIIPTFNRCESLRRALLSVIAQSHAAREIIVIDDGSTDATATMLKAEFPEVAYYFQNNGGVSAARNAGITRAKSTWLAFLDSDDEWLPEKLAHQVKRLNANPTLKVCHTEEIWIRHGHRVNAMKKHAKPGGWIFRQCLPLCAISPSSIMIHRAVFDAVGLFDTALPACEDYDLWLRISARYPVACIETPQIIKYGGHDDQLSRKHWGMDRFRIQALQNIIENGALQTDDRSAAIAMLLKKASIYSSGCKKRGKNAEAGHYLELVERYQADSLTPK